MNDTMHTSRRLGSAVGLTALCLVATGAGPAPADSATIAYTCEVGSFHGENDGQSDGFAMEAKFNSAIEDAWRFPSGRP